MATKAASYRPAGFKDVTPYLVVKEAARLIDFLKAAFGAEEVYRAQRPDGSLMHAQLKIGDSIIEMGEARDTWEPMRSPLHFYVPDADAVFKRAVAAGATVVYDLADMPYGERSGGVQDPAGNQWYIATRTEELTEEEIEERMKGH